MRAVRGHHPRTSGLTLLEVLVALSLGSLVILMSHALSRAAGDGARAILQATDSWNQRSNGTRWLRSTVASMLPPQDSALFEGQPSELEFTAATLRGGGWFAPERIRIHLQDGIVVAERSEEGLLELTDSVMAIRFDYLLWPGRASVWVPQWASSLTTPLAIRLRVMRDGSAGRGVVDTTTYLLRDRR